MKGSDKGLGPTVQPTEASFEHLLGGGPMTTHLPGRPWDTGQNRSTARILILTQSYHQLLWAALFLEFFHWSTRGEAMLVCFLSAMEKYRQQGSARWGLRCRVAPPTPLGIHKSLNARWFPMVLPGTWWGGFHTLYIDLTIKWYNNKLVYSILQMRNLGLEAVKTLANVINRCGIGRQSI